MKMIEENEVRFIDLRFTDTRGKEQHVGLPVSAFEEDHFEHGHPFDGSSIAGWKGIQASDMILLPEASSAYVDPFFDESTLVLTCDVIEPSDGNRITSYNVCYTKLLRQQAHRDAPGGGAAQGGDQRTANGVMFENIGFEIDLGARGIDGRFQRGEEFGPGLEQRKLVAFTEMRPQFALTHAGRRNSALRQA